MNEIEKRPGNIMIILIFAIYVIASAGALMLIKTGSMNTTFSRDGSILKLMMDWRVLAGLLIYICSFLISIYLMSQMNLSVFYPVGAGLVFIIITIFSFTILHEPVSIKQVIALILILAGIIIGNIK